MIKVLILLTSLLLTLNATSQTQPISPAIIMYLLGSDSKVANTTDLTRGLIAHYKFDENAIDSSGNENNGTEYGGIIYTDGVNSKAASFDGINDYVDIGPLLSGKDNFTLSMWIKTSQIIQGSSRYLDPAIIGAKQLGGISNDFLLSNMNGQIGWYDEFGYSNSFIYSDLSIADDSWHQLSVIREATLLTFYLDGKKVGTDETGDWVASDQNIEVGRALWSGSLYFQGLVDELFVYNRSLSEDEVAELYTQEKVFKAINQKLSVPADVATEITLSSLFPTTANSLTYIVTTPPSHGTVTVTGNKVSYTPSEGYSGEDRFSFIANDGTMNSKEATVSMNISYLTLDGLRWELPCTSTNPGPGSCTAQFTNYSESGVVGGTPGQTYILNLRFRGVVEQNSYAGGEQDGYWYTDGHPNNSSYNVYKLEISDPEQYYYINAGTAGIAHTWALDYNKSLEAKAGATITLSVDTADSALITNYDENATPIIIPGIAPAPNSYNGQFLQLDLINYSEVPPTTTPANSLFDITQNGLLPSRLNQSMVCIDTINTTYYTLQLDEQSNAKIILNGSLSDTGTYSTSNNILTLNLPTYNNQYVHDSHISINNNTLGYFNGRVNNSGSLACIAYKHSVGSKLAMDTKIECRNSYTTITNVTEFYKRDFTLYANGTSILEIDDELITNRVMQTMYGSYFYDQNSGKFALSYMNVDLVNNSAEPVTWYGQTDGVNVSIDNLDMACSF